MTKDFKEVLSSLAVLQVLLLILKFADRLTWSWWLILVPLWILTSIFLLLFWIFVTKHLALQTKYRIFFGKHAADDLFPRTGEDQKGR